MDRIANVIKKVNHRGYSLILSLLLDFGIVAAAYGIALFSRAVLTFKDFSTAPPAIFLATVLTLIVMYLFGVYHRIWRQTSGHEVIVIVYSVAASTALFIVIDLVVQPRLLPLSVPIVGSMLSLAGLVAVRYRSRLVGGLRWRWRAVWKREFPSARIRVLIVGAGESGQDLAWRLRHRFPGNHYNVVGFIDDDPQKHGMYVEGCQVIGGREVIADSVQRYDVDLIVVAIHNISGPAFREILSHCQQSDARIKVIPDLFELVRNPGSKAPLRDIQPEDLIGRKVVTRHDAVNLSPVTNKVILITGAAGSIGSELSHQIMDYDPTQVILLDNNESGLHDLIISLQDSVPAH